MNWLEDAKKCYHARGYLVIGATRSYRIGDLVNHVNVETGLIELPQPFAIIAETDRTDYIEQARIAGRKHCEPPACDTYFYRMVTE